MTILNLIRMAESFQKSKKTLWEKVKLITTSNFSFCIVFQEDLNSRHVKTSDFLDKV